MRHLIFYSYVDFEIVSIDVNSVVNYKFIKMDIRLNERQRTFYYGWGEYKLRNQTAECELFCNYYPEQIIDQSKVSRIVSKIHVIEVIGPDQEGQER